MTPFEFRRIRKSLGLTQKEMAPALGFSFAQKISNMETGHKPIPKHVERLMLAYSQLGYVPRVINEIA